MEDSTERLYTSLAEAIALGKSRVSMVDTFDPLENRLRAVPTAVLWRHVATPNFELLHFASVAREWNLHPLVLTFNRDKFVTRNPAKCALARLRFSSNPSDGSYSTIVAADWAKAEGEMISDVRAASGDWLVNFHQKFLSSSELSEVRTLDISDWLHVHGPTAKSYYRHFFALFTRSAILFDTFLGDSKEEQFTLEVVIPAFDAAFLEHGQRPLICRLDPAGLEGHSHWLRYPIDFYSTALALLDSESNRPQANMCTA